MIGTGAPTESAVEERARELAIIRGGQGSAVTHDDREQAKREVSNQDMELSTDEETEMPLAEERRHGMAAKTGHQVKEHRPGDTQLISEEEIREGLKEAEHDTMLNARTADEGA